MFKVQNVLIMEKFKYKCKQSSEPLRSRHRDFTIIFCVTTQFLHILKQVLNIISSIIILVYISKR